MLFAVMCTDKPGALEVRKANREEHLAYLGRHDVQFAGPFLSDEGAPIGSLIVVELADRAAAEAFCDNDPYAKADLFERVEIRAWKRAVG